MRGGARRLLPSPSPVGRSGTYPFNQDASFVPNYSAINRVTCFRLSHGTLFVVAASNKSPPCLRVKKKTYTYIYINTCLLYRRISINDEQKKKKGEKNEPIYKNLTGYYI